MPGHAGAGLDLRLPDRRPGRDGLRAVELDPLAVVSGLVITQVAEAWFIDRMVLLYEDMKARDPGYAGWER